MGKLIKELKRQVKAEIAKEESAFYNLRSILGCYNWAIFYFLIGARQAGKSYAITDFLVKQFVKKGIPFYWLRLTETSARKLLANNAEKLVDPDLRRKYGLDLITNGNNVYAISKRSKPDKNGKAKILEKKFMCGVYNLATFYNDKGSGLYDKDFLNDPNMKYHICLDEMNREKGEKKSFDIVYAFVNQIENLVRNTKDKIRVFCIGNTLEEASDLLSAFNFIPEEFGRYKLKSKRAVIDYLEPTTAYKEMRKGSIADILMPAASTFANKIDSDYSLIYTGRLTKPTNVIKFSKDIKDWFTIWDSAIISQYNKEKVPVIAMKPYLDEFFDTHLRDQIILNFDYRNYAYKNLVTFKLFQKNVNLLKPRGN